MRTSFGNYLPGAVALVVLMTSCGDGRSEAHRQLQAELDSTRPGRMLSLEQYHLPLVVELPVDTGQASVQWNDAMGRLLVRAGDGFAIQIHESPADMGRVKADLERDLVRQNKITTDRPDLLVYRSQFADDDKLVFYHFIKSVEADGRTFQVEDIRGDRPFAASEIIWMTKAVRAPEPA